MGAEASSHCSAVPCTDGRKEWTAAPCTDGGLWGGNMPPDGEASSDQTLPGDFVVGQTVHYVGPNYIFESSGMGLEHGMQGTVVGHSEAVPDEWHDHPYIGVHFHGHRVPTNVTPEAVSKIPVPKVPRMGPKPPRADAVWSFSASSDGRGKVEALTNRYASLAVPESPRYCGASSAPLIVGMSLMPDTCGAPLAAQQRSLYSNADADQVGYNVLDALPDVQLWPRDGEADGDVADERRHQEKSPRCSVFGTVTQKSSLSANGRLVQKQSRSNAREYDEKVAPDDVNRRSFAATEALRCCASGQAVEQKPESV